MRPNGCQGFILPSSSLDYCLAQRRTLNFEALSQDYPGERSFKWPADPEPRPAWRCFLRPGYQLQDRLQYYYDQCAATASVAHCPAFVQLLRMTWTMKRSVTTLPCLGMKSGPTIKLLLTGDECWIYRISGQRFQLRFQFSASKYLTPSTGEQPY